MSPATAGLLGAVIGGALTALSSLGIETWRGWRAGRKEAEHREKELRQVARLVVEELAVIADIIEDSAKSGEWWSMDRALPTSTWNEDRRLLAAELEAMEWRLTANAFQGADRMNWRRRAHHDSSGLSLGGEDVGQLRVLFRDVQNAMIQLDAKTGPRGIFGRAGYADVDDLEERAFGSLGTPAE